VHFKNDAVELSRLTFKKLPFGPSRFEIQKSEGRPTKIYLKKTIERTPNHEKQSNKQFTPNN
jgi:hypothetical protein